MSVTLHCDVGDLKLELYCEETPKTAKNFIALAASGYYDGCKFHRNIKGFMAQTGDPTGREFKKIPALFTHQSIIVFDAGCESLCSTEIIVVFNES